MGQKDWKDHGSGVNDHIVMPEIIRDLYYTAMRMTLFGKMNLGREIKTTDIIHQGNTLQIDSGNDSPVWEKQLNENNEARFTMRDQNKGMATYGDADVKPGDFAAYLHSVVHARLVDTPAYPVVGFESADNFKRVVNNLVKVEKENIARWIATEMDFDAFRALLMGASRGLLDTQNGGKGIKLVGTANAGDHRSNYNTFVSGNNALTTQDANAATHNTALATLLDALTAGEEFGYESHRNLSAIIDSLLIQPVKVGGREYRAVAITDIRNIYSLRADDKMARLWEIATPRAEDNLAVYSRDALILDDVLYIPTHQLSFFRPSVDGNTITYGAGMDKDPRSSSFSNTSNITMTIVLGRGALLRGRRKGDVKFTEEVGRHGKGAEYAAHYDDGWMRKEWSSHDDKERQRMVNDSSFTMFNYDAGSVVGT